MKIFLAGEGRTDLGDWDREPQYRSAPPVQGCIEVLLRQVQSEGWAVEQASCWRNLRKYQAGQHRTAETRNVLGAFLAAQEADCDAVVFVRDQDGDVDRQEQMEAGLRDAAEDFSALKSAGGVAVRDIEAWVLACRGELQSELVRDTTAALREDHGIETTAHKVDALQAADLDSLPSDARSLALWVERVRALFADS